jgi:hypothetical protein
MDIRNTSTIVLYKGKSEEKRQELLDYFHATFENDEAPFKPFTSYIAASGWHIVATRQEIGSNNMRRRFVCLYLCEDMVKSSP